jgi:hypothetical protein
MAMQNGESQEQQPQDVLDQDQQSLDVEQGIAEEPQFVTKEAYQQMQQAYDAKLAQQGRHLSGLESRIDTQTNAMAKQLGDMAANSARAEIERREQELLARIEDPDERARMQTMLELQSLRNPQPVVEQPMQVAPQPQPQQPTPEDWAQVQRFVQNFGVNPNDPRIQYSILTDPTLTDVQRQEQFLANLGSVGANAAPAVPQGQPPQAATTSTPTRASGPVGTGYRNIDDVYNAFNSDQIDRDAFKTAASKFGVTV